MDALSRRRAAVSLAAAAVLVACSDTANPVKWTASIDGPGRVAQGSMLRVRLDARSARGWYFYSITQPPGGPTPTRIWLPDTTIFRLAGAVSAPAPSRSFDNTFRMNVEKYTGAASFTIPVRASAGAPPGKSELRVAALYQACNDTICLSPRTATLTVQVRIE